MACKYVDKFIGLYAFLRKIPFFCCFERVFFISTYIDVNNIIAKNPKTFSATKYKNTHSIPVLPQITLFYRIVDENTIELVRFWNNKKDPKKLHL